MTRPSQRSSAPSPAHIPPGADQYVYFLEDTETHLVKIGTTWGRRLMERVREHERTVGRPCVLLAAADGGRRVERAYHDRLRDTREHGEWFRPSPVLTEIVAGLRYWHSWASLLGAPGVGQ